LQTGKTLTNIVQHSTTSRGDTIAPNHHQMTDRVAMLLFDSATQYYVAGRFSFLYDHGPVCGNLFHHAVEMYLKGVLAKSMSMDLDTLRIKFGHDLIEIWRCFAIQLDEQDVNRLRPSIDRLHQCECLRYPGSVLKNGAGMLKSPYIEGIESFKSLKPSKAMTDYSIPQYYIVLEDVDILVNKIFSVAKVDPKFLLGKRGGKRLNKTLEILKEKNRHFIFDV